MSDPNNAGAICREAMKEVVAQRQKLKARIGELEGQNASANAEKAGLEQNVADLNVQLGLAQNAVGKNYLPPGAVEQFINAALGRAGYEAGGASGDQICGLLRGRAELIRHEDGGYEITVASADGEKMLTPTEAAVELLSDPTNSNLIDAARKGRYELIRSDDERVKAAVGNPDLDIAALAKIRDPKVRQRVLSDIGPEGRAKLTAPKTPHGML